MHDRLDGPRDAFEGLLIGDENMEGRDHLDVGQLPDMQVVDRDHVGDGLDLFTDLFDVDTNGNSLEENERG